MYGSSDLRKGLKIEIEGQPFVITEFTFSKPGKGQAIYNCKLKNLITGSTMSKSYRSNDKIDRPALTVRNLQYSYLDADGYVFMDENYEHVTIGADILGNNRFFLVEDMTVEVLFHNDRAIEITLPTFIEKTIIHTEPGARGNTATNVMKPATVEGGYEIPVPLFINQGDVIRIDTRTGGYVERVNN